MPSAPAVSVKPREPLCHIEFGLSRETGVPTLPKVYPVSSQEARLSTAALSEIIRTPCCGRGACVAPRREGRGRGWTPRQMRLCPFWASRGMVDRRLLLPVDACAGNHARGGGE